MQHNADWFYILVYGRIFIQCTFLNLNFLLIIDKYIHITNLNIACI